MVTLNLGWQNLITPIITPEAATRLNLNPGLLTRKFLTIEATKSARLGTPRRLKRTNSASSFAVQIGGKKILVVLWLQLRS